MSGSSSFNSSNKALLDDAVTCCGIQPLVLFCFVALNCLSPYMNSSYCKTGDYLLIKAAIRDTVPKTARQVLNCL